MRAANIPMRRIAYAAVLLVALTVSASAETLRMGPPELTAVRSADASTELVARFPVSERVPTDGNAVVWSGPPDVFDDGAGEPRVLPVDARAAVALPARRAPGLTVTGWTWLREPGAPVDVSHLVELGAVHVVRGVPVVSVRVLAEAPGGGLLGELRLRLDHTPAGEYRVALARAVPEKISARAALGERTVVNGDLFRRLHDGLAVDRAAKAADGAKATRFGMSENWLRLEIEDTGPIMLTATQMEVAGVSSQGVDPADLRLFRADPQPQTRDPEEPGSWAEGWDGLDEVAILPSSEVTWGAGDQILFYGVGPDAWLDRIDPAADPLDHVEHLYANTSVYWLTWEDFDTESPFGGEPLRISAVAAPAHGVTPTSTHRRRLHLEEANVEAYGRLEDQWSWTSSITTDKIVEFEDADAVPGGELFYAADVRAYLYKGSASFMEHRATVRLNEDETGAATRSWYSSEEDDSLRIRAVGTSSALRAGLNFLTIAKASDTGAPNLMLDSVDFLYPATLRKASGILDVVHWGETVAAPDTPVDLRIADAAASSIVWDVSDPLHPSALTGTADGGHLVLGFTRQPGTNRHLLIAGTTDLRSPVTRVLRRPGDLRAMSRDLDYVILAPPEFMAAASLLGAFREGDLPGVADPAVAVIDASRVYDAFGGGVRDPMALRNFFKWVWNGSAGRFTEVCLLGDCSRDYRNHRNIFGDILPTWVRTKFPLLYTDYSSYPYASDDYLVAFDSVDYIRAHDVPDLASGRLTVRTAEEALERVETIIAYASAPEEGDWRNRVVMAADDLTQPSSPTAFQDEHTEQSEHLADTYLPESLDLHKVYLVDYEKPAGVNYKPAARQRAREEWNEGLTLFHYIGHGADNTLADEQLFLTDDIYGLDNGMKRGVFLAFSCDVGIYDQVTKQSMAETFVAQPEGAAIAAIAASQVSYINPNNSLSNYFYANLFPGRSVDPAQTLGRALWSAKVMVGDFTSDWFLANAVRFLLHGDPALRLPHPVDDLTLDASSADALGGGRREEIALILSDQGLSPADVTGYSLLVQEAREDKSATNGYSTLHWWRPGAVTFRGEGGASSDTLRVPFMVPLQLRYGDHGKVRLLLETVAGPRAVSADLPVVQAGTGTVNDVHGPEIALTFEDDRYRVKAGTVLRSVVHDTSGVSILGTNPLNSVMLEFDYDGRMTNVSDAFRFDANSFTTGGLEVPLSGDLAMGDHTVTLYASDVLGNVGSDTLSFRMVAGDVARIDDVTVFPNPTPGPARLLFELSDPMAVEWALYTLAGDRVTGLHEDFPSAGPHILHWDGRDDRGDELANGVYLYVLRGEWAGDPDHDIVVTGQLVMMK